MFVGDLDKDRVKGTGTQKASMRYAVTTSAIRRQRDRKHAMKQELLTAMNQQATLLRQEYDELKNFAASFLLELRANFATLASLSLQHSGSLQEVQSEISTFKSQANEQMSKLYDTIDDLNTRLLETASKTKALKREIPCKFFQRGLCCRDECSFQHVGVGDAVKGKGKDKTRTRSKPFRPCILCNGSPCTCRTVPSFPSFPTTPIKSRDAFDELTPEKQPRSGKAKDPQEDAPQGWYCFNAECVAYDIDMKPENFIGPEYTSCPACGFEKPPPPPRASVDNTLAKQQSVLTTVSSMTLPAVRGETARMASHQQQPERAKKGIRPALEF